MVGVTNSVLRAAHWGAVMPCKQHAVGPIPTRSTNMNANAKRPSATVLNRVLEGSSPSAFTNTMPV